MTKRPNTEKEAASARALTGFNQVAGLIRASAEFARTADRFVNVARQQIPIAAPALVSRTAQNTEAKRSSSDIHIGPQSSPERNRQRARGNVSQSVTADALHAIDGFAKKVKAIESVKHVREGVLVDKANDRVGIASGAKTSIASREPSARASRRIEDTTDKFARLIEQSSSGMDALTRIGNAKRRFGVGNDSIFGKAGVERSGSSWSGLSGRATRMLDRIGGSSIGSEEGSERGFGKYVAASRVPRSSMVAPTGLSRPEFAEPMRGVYGQESRNAAGSITINSTPTVVINESEGSGDVERQVLGALRAHRDELFDQFKRESVRRERAEF